MASGDFLEASVGFVAGSLTTFSFLPQVVKSWRLRETRDISFWMYMGLSTGMILWIVHGILIMDWPLIIANSISLLLAIIVLGFKFKFG